MTEKKVIKTIRYNYTRDCINYTNKYDDLKEDDPIQILKFNCFNSEDFKRGALYRMYNKTGKSMISSSSSSKEEESGSEDTDYVGEASFPIFNDDIHVFIMSLNYRYQTTRLLKTFKSVKDADAYATSQFYLYYREHIGKKEDVGVYINDEEKWNNIDIEFENNKKSIKCDIKESDKPKFIVLISSTGLLIVHPFNIYNMGKYDWVQIYKNPFHSPLFSSDSNESDSYEEEEKPKITLSSNSNDSSSSSSCSSSSNHEEDEDEDEDEDEEEYNINKRKYTQSSNEGYDSINKIRKLNSML